jgi:hypothetical protein
VLTKAPPKVLPLNHSRSHLNPPDWCARDPYLPNNCPCTCRHEPAGQASSCFIFFTYLPLLVLLYILVVFVLIRRAAALDDSQTADVIVVLGAAQYNGRPSPVFKARLDHTANLFRRNFANRILTTGGYGLDRRFSEAGVGKSYLEKQNIPEIAFLPRRAVRPRSTVLKRA